MGSRSPSDIGLEVVAGLIAIGGQRERAVEALRQTVHAAIAELDPQGLRDTSATWWEDHPWSRPDGFDRLRRAFEDLELLEAQSKEITDGLRSMLNPTAIKPSRVPTPIEAHRRLIRIADRRIEDLKLIELAARSVRQGLTTVTVRALRRCLRDMRDEEQRASTYRDRLGRLLSMADVIDRAG